MTAASLRSGRRVPLGLTVAALAFTALAAGALWLEVNESEETRARTAATAGHEQTSDDLVAYEDINAYAAGNDPAYGNVLSDVVETRIRPWGEERSDVYAGAFVSDGTVYVGFTDRHEAMLAEVRALVDLPPNEVVAFRASRPYQRYAAVLNDLSTNAERYARDGAPVRLAVFEAPLQAVHVAMAGEGESAKQQYDRLLELVDYDELLTAVPQGGTAAAAGS